MSEIHQQNVIELAAMAVRTTTLTTSAVDILNYEGVGHIILQSSAATAGTTPTLNVKLQHCATSGGSYADVTGAAFAEVTDSADTTQMLSVDVSALQRYVKVVGTIAGTNTPTFGFGVSMVARAKQGRNASQAV